MGKASAFVLAALLLGTIALAVRNAMDTTGETLTENPTSAEDTQAPPSTVVAPTAALSTGSPTTHKKPDDGEVSWTTVELPPEVAAIGPVTVWTGEQLILWGGQDETSQNVPAGEIGVMFDPVEARWQHMAPGPKPAAYGAAAVWTGEVLLVTGGSVAHGKASSATAAYDPAEDTWIELTDAPLASEYTQAVWTGSHLLSTAQEGVGVYDPSDDTWRVASAPPVSLGRLREVVWTGHQLVVWPSPGERKTYRGLLFDLGTDSWQVLPEPPAWPAMPDIVWTGEHLIVWGGLPAHRATSERAVGSMFELSSGTWTELPEALPEPEGCECNLGSQTLIWTGTEVIVHTGFFATGVDREASLLLAFNPGKMTWSHLGRAPAQLGPGLMAGDQIVFRADRLYLPDFKR